MADELAPYLGEEGCIRLMQCFLNPQLMLCHLESPKPLWELVAEGTKPKLEREEKEIDLLYQLFIPKEHQQIGEDFGQCQVYYSLLEFLYDFDVYICWNRLPLSFSFSSH